ncbi:hypothetical protein R1sor_013617 [Riccia sorocarpa]|uniref:Uncharacterized protein n=1 Tax=Riccia sorocarpa TaxID=122646 RepID=A0ABD3H7P0_9MARC
MGEEEDDEEEEDGREGEEDEDDAEDVDEDYDDGKTFPYELSAGDLAAAVGDFTRVIYFSTSSTIHRISAHEHPLDLVELERLRLMSYMKERAKTTMEKTHEVVAQAFG